MKGQRKGMGSPLKLRLQTGGEGPRGPRQARRVPVQALSSRRLPKGWQMETVTRKTQACALSETAVPGKLAQRDAWPAGLYTWVS